MPTLTTDQLSTLCTMLSYRRPHGSGGDHTFRLRFLSDLPGCVEDAFGNLIVRVGDSPILWSSHTDTVHHSSGFQTLHVDLARHEISLSRKSRRLYNCLGADDTVGVFIMREMILAGVPGVYIFHYGEEEGGIGSGRLAWQTPEVLAGVQFAIALDRQGTQDVVTHQLCGRTCSDRFVASLALQLPGKYSGARGVYTDTAEYADIIPECTNLSVGYYHQHSPDEWVDYAHVGRLLDALLSLDASLLVCDRDPEAVSYTVGQFASTDYRAPLTRRDSDYGYDEWCFYCHAPIIDPEELEEMLQPPDHCICEPDDVYNGLTDADAKFLRYLRER